MNEVFMLYLALFTRLCLSLFFSSLTSADSFITRLCFDLLGENVRMVILSSKFFIRSLMVLFYLSSLILLTLLSYRSIFASTSFSSSFNWPWFVVSVLRINSNIFYYEMSPEFNAIFYSYFFKKASYLSMISSFSFWKVSNCLLW